MLRQAFLSNHEIVHVNTNNIEASSDRRYPAEDNHNSSMAHYYGGYGPGPASHSSCATDSDTLEINTSVGRVTGELTDKSGVSRTEVDDAKGGQAIMETATSHDIKYAAGASTLRNAGDTSEVMDITETTEENENTPDVYRAWTNDPRLTTSIRDMPSGDLSATQAYNNPASCGVSANMVGLVQDTTAKVRVFRETDKADNTEATRFPKTGVSPSIRDTCGAPASHYAADTRRSDTLRPEWMGYNRLPEDAPPRARFVPAQTRPKRRCGAQLPVTTTTTNHPTQPT